MEIDQSPVQGKARPLSRARSLLEALPGKAKAEVIGIWAVLTVVVIFEFTVGGTLSKSFNRGLATLLAGALGLGAQYLASLSGEKGQPFVLGMFVFLLAAASTFTRFFPRIKARYDYGVLIFILTFSLVSVSGVPSENLHNSAASNMENLASYLEGFGGEYFQSGEGSSSDRSFLEGYKKVLNSKPTEDTMANLARWEPGHGRFGFRHPWKQYLKIGALSRQCAYQIEILNGYINSDSQVPLEFRCKIQESCTQISAECGKALKSLASAIKTMTIPSSANVHVENSKTAVKDLQISLKAVSLEHDQELLAISARCNSGIDTS
ncbi:hypothetical protein OIU84_010308 [Salix udensis]|uniref:Uncharacterized protein n=1 Tax=Salix udensis TaxID=889485 RepID=A0AAD6NVM0_9ROSI|nr:hypothetical protein OIU84_010308 [Salix udensis]